MNFKKYNNIKEFTDENLELILEKEWLNNLMVGNCLEGLEKGMNEWLLANVSVDNKIELIILYRKPWNLLLYSPTNNLNEDLYKFVAEKIYEIDKNVAGVLAEKEIANLFAKNYARISNKEMKLDFPMRILLLKEMSKANLLDNVIFRSAKREEAEILKQYMKEFHLEALGVEWDTQTIEEHLEKYFEKGFYVLEVDGKIVSQAVIARSLTKGCAISEVYTPKEFRGKGYAYNLIYRFSKKCLEDGAEYCVLYTDDQNPISNHVYEKVGYIRMKDCADIKFI